MSNYFPRSPAAVHTPITVSFVQPPSWKGWRLDFRACPKTCWNPLKVFIMLKSRCVSPSNQKCGFFFCACISAASMQTFAHLALFTTSRADLKQARGRAVTIPTGICIPNDLSNQNMLFTWPNIVIFGKIVETQSVSLWWTQRTERN